MFLFLLFTLFYLFCLPVPLFVIFFCIFCLHEIFFFFSHKLATIPRQGKVWVKEGLGEGGMMRRLGGSDTCISASDSG